MSQKSKRSKGGKNAKKTSRNSNVNYPFITTDGRWILGDGKTYAFNSGSTKIIQYDEAGGWALVEETLTLVPEQSLKKLLKGRYD